MEIVSHFGEFNTPTVNDAHSETLTLTADLMVAIADSFNPYIPHRGWDEILTEAVGSMPIVINGRRYILEDLYIDLKVQQYENKHGPISAQEDHPEVMFPFKDYVIENFDRWASLVTELMMRTFGYSLANHEVTVRKIRDDLLLIEDDGDYRINWFNANYKPE